MPKAKVHQSQFGIEKSNLPTGLHGLTAAAAGTNCGLNRCQTEEFLLSYTFYNPF